MWKCPKRSRESRNTTQDHFCAKSKAIIARWCMDYCEGRILPVFEKRCSGDLLKIEDFAGHTVTQKGKRYFVLNYEDKLAKL